MNDFDYENMQKKRIARGVYAKKGGSRSKKCTLPGDYLTPAQKAKLSTTKVSVNLKKPMTWKEFKALPTDIKIEYLSYLRDEHGALRAWVAQDLFCVTSSAFTKYIERYEPKLKGIFPKSGKYTADRRSRWLDFVYGRLVDPDPVEEPEPESTPEPEPECTESIKETPKAAPAHAALVPSHINATYNCELYVDDLNAIFYRLLKDRPCKSITIDITF